MWCLRMWCLIMIVSTLSYKYMLSNMGSNNYSYQHHILKHIPELPNYTAVCRTIHSFIDSARCSRQSGVQEERPASAPPSAPDIKINNNHNKTNHNHHNNSSSHISNNTNSNTNDTDADDTSSVCTAPPSMKQTSSKQACEYIYRANYTYVYMHIHINDMYICVYIYIYVYTHT